MPEGPILTEEECNVDACILGTGLTESLVAAAVARHGQRVLHLDRAQGYGGNWRSLNLTELEAWVGEAEGDEEPEAGEEEAEAPVVGDITGLRVIDLAARPPASCFRVRTGSWNPFGAMGDEECDALRTELLKRPGGWSVDLVPRLLFGRSELVDVLVESGVSRYLEFQGLRSARVMTTSGLVAVPLTKSDIFQDPVLSLPEKRTLMRFITSMAPFVGSLAFESPAQLGVDQAHKLQGPAEVTAPEGVNLDEPWALFLQRQKLSPRLQDFLTYAICLWDWSQPTQSESAASPPDAADTLSTREGMQCLGRFVSSLGLHGKGTGMPLLYPMYGASDMAQGFVRMCALHRGIYALRTSVTKLLVSQDSTTGSWQAAGVVTQRGEVIRAKAVVASHDHFCHRGSGDGQAGAPRAPAVASAARPAVASCKRMVVLMTRSLLGEEGVNLCVVPPGATTPPLANVVQVMQLDWATGACPRGYHVLHLSQAARLPEAVEGGSVSFDDLDRALRSLLAHCVEDGKGEASCVYRCRFLQQPRPVDRAWAHGTPDGDIISACVEGRSLLISTDPAAVPQLLVGNEVPEAKDVFLRCPIYGGSAPGVEDFLRKPPDVALQEQSTAMEDLENFNEQMQSAGDAQTASAAAATSGHESPESAKESPCGDTAPPQLAEPAPQQLAEPGPQVAEPGPQQPHGP